MNFFEKIITNFGKIITTIGIFIAFSLTGTVIGLIIYELMKRTDVGLTICIGLGIIGSIAGISAARKSLKMGYFNFTAKTYATNELDDPELVKEFYSTDSKKEHNQK